jgi:hypothetical protein
MLMKIVFLTPEFKLADDADANDRYDEYVAATEYLCDPPYETNTDRRDLLFELVDEHGAPVTDKCYERAKAKDVSDVSDFKLCPSSAPFLVHAVGFFLDDICYDCPYQVRETIQHLSGKVRAGDTGYSNGAISKQSAEQLKNLPKLEEGVTYEKREVLYRLLQELQEMERAEDNEWFPKYCSFIVVDQPKEKQNSKEIADDDQPLEPAAAKRLKRA